MKKIFFAIIMLAMIFSLSSPVFADNFRWNNAGGDNQAETAANWTNTTPGGIKLKPTNPWDTIEFGTAGNTANITNVIYQNANVTFNSAADFSITATGSGVFGIGYVTPSSDGITAQNPDATGDASSRTYYINAPVKLYDSQTWTVLNNGAGGIDTTTLTVTGNIGDGSNGYGLTKAGTGTLTLMGVNTYTGATTVSAGTLKAGAVGPQNNAFGNGSAVTVGTGAATATLDVNGTSETIGSLAGASDGIVTNSAVGTAVTLTVGNTTSTIFSGTIQNGTSALGLSLVGTGTLTLTGANTYSGATTIGAGSTLRAGSAGALGTSVVTNSAAAGTLDIGTTSLALGAGSYVQGGATSTLTLTVNSSSAFGNITAAGVNNVTNGVVNVAVNGYIPNGATLAILTGAAGSAYAPATITSTNSYVNFIGSTSAAGVYTLTATRSGGGFSHTAINSNGAAVGGVLDNVNSPSTDMFTVLTALGNSSSSQVSSSENSMSPTNDGAITQSAQAMLNNFTNNTVSHLDNVRTTGGATGIATGDDCLNGVDIWAQGLGDYAHQDPRGSSNGYNATSWGVSGGADKSLYNDQIRVGLGSGYGQTSVNSKDFSGNTNINSIPATIYCDYTNNNLPVYINAAFTFIYNMYNGSRQVMAGPTITRTANQDYDGEQYSGYLEGGYSFFYKKLSLTPLASFQYMHLHTGSYTETNAGALDLNVASQDYDMAQTGFGAKLACPFDNKYGTLTPNLHFKWLYDWVGDNQATTASFAGGGSAFGTNGFAPAQSEWDFGARLDFKTKYNITIGLDYDFLCKADYYEHFGTLDVKYSF